MKRLLRETVVVVSGGISVNLFRGAKEGKSIRSSSEKPRVPTCVPSWKVASLLSSLPEEYSYFKGGGGGMEGGILMSKEREIT